MKLKLILHHYWIICLLILASSCSLFDTGDEDPGTTKLTSIEIGPTIEVASSTIPVAGGTIKVSKPDSPVNGMEITIPANSFPSGQTFKVSYSEIKSHDFGQNFNPISPMITIAYDGGYSSELMSITIPVKIPEGHIPLGFYLDETTGKLEGIPVQSVTSNSITLLTRHFLSGSKLHGGTSTKSANAEAVKGANIVISSISESILNSQPIIASGFKPGVDDWEFANRGSYIASGGHCAGQNMVAMWYYFEKKPTEGNLFNKFSDNANLWQDNAKGYRFCSVIHQDLGWDGIVNYLFGRFIDKNQGLDKLKLYTIAGTMLITREPQGIGIYRQTGTNLDDTPKYGGHDLICYQVSVSGGKLYISDPNTPGTAQTIEFTNNKFQPYLAKINAEAVSNPYPFVTYYAKTAYIEWEKIEKRWSELLNNTIGTIAPNIFPAYTIWVKDGAGYELKDGTTTSKDTLRTITICPTAEVYDIVANQKIIGTDIFDQNGNLLSKAESNGQVRVILKPGLNKLGYYIIGWRKDYLTTNGTNYKNQFVDFKWINVIYSLAVETNPVTNITQTTATSGGNVKSDGGFPVTARGVCWSTSSNPTTANSKTTDGNGTGLFTSNLTGLTANTLYYVRAYATNSAGTVYGEQKQFTTTGGGGDDRIYTYKTLGTQTWMTENLAYLPAVSVSKAESETEPHYYVYAYEGTSMAAAKATANYATYGVLYNWAAAKTACPTGWHLPTDAEWTILTDYLTNNGYGYEGSGNDIGKSMAATSGWDLFATEGTVGNNQASNNRSGFTALPGGSRGDGGGFYDLGDYAQFWSASGDNASGAWDRDLTYYYGVVGRNVYHKSRGFSVRCVKN